MDLTQTTKWHLQNGSLLSTAEIFSKIMANEINSNQMCCCEQKDQWQPISDVFQIIGRYGVLKELGNGMFGKVYLGFETGHKKGRLVAIKKPTASVIQKYAHEAGKKGKEGEMWARMSIGQVFSEEVALTARLALCPYVVKVLDHNVAEPFIVLEFCNGGTLADRILQPYITADVIQWGYQISSGLLAAHSLQPDHMIHRDLKPQNILLYDGNVKISDFGTSKMAYKSESLSSLEGGYTPKYAAPEAIDGRAYPATDVWSFGVIMYKAISGHFPFEGDNLVALIAKITNKPHTPLECHKINIDTSILALVDDCLQKDPSKRPSTNICVETFKLLLQQNSTKQTLKKSPKKISTVKRRAHRNLQKNSQKLFFAKIIGSIIVAVLCLLWLLNKDTKPGKKKVSSVKKVIKKASAKKIVKKTDAKEKIAGFKYLGEKTYSFNQTSNRVKEYRHSKTGLEFVLIPKDSLAPFLIAKYEITQDIWQQVMGDNPSQFKANKRPVENVTWKQAQQFCQKLELQLPTEAQWEYACRSKTTTIYYWGNQWNDNNLVCKSYWQKILFSRGKQFDKVDLVKEGTITLEVGNFRPNAFGLYDMLGNVFEWCSDWSGNTSKKIIRGGAWSSPNAQCHPKNKWHFETSHKQNDIGFRPIKNMGK